MNKYADLEYLSLVDRISKDYNQFLQLVVGNERDAQPMNHTAFRILIECHQSEDKMSDNDIVHLMRLDDTEFSQALVELIGLEYIYTSQHSEEEGARVLNLTVSGTLLAERYESLIDTIIDDDETLSNLILTDIEREDLLVSLIALQNRTKSLLRRLAS